LEARNAKIVFQFSLGAEPLPFETASRLSQRTIKQLGEMISRHPKIKFQSFLASRHCNQALCTMCRELPNFSLSGYWWLNFFPSAMRQIMEERLDMVPLNKQVGFFSDAYCLDWTYGKSKIVLNQLAAVLADKVAMGQYSRNEALRVAHAILYETPQELLGMRPAAVGSAAGT
jgi:glucuronate isomerase